MEYDDQESNTRITESASPRGSPSGVRRFKTDADCVQELVDAKTRLGIWDPSLKPHPTYPHQFRSHERNSVILVTEGTIFKGAKALTTWVNVIWQVSKRATTGNRFIDFIECIRSVTGTEKMPTDKTRAHWIPTLQRLLPLPALKGIVHVGMFPFTVDRTSIPVIVMVQTTIGAVTQNFHLVPLLNEMSEAFESALAPIAKLRGVRIDHQLQRLVVKNELDRQFAPSEAVSAVVIRFRKWHEARVAERRLDSKQPPLLRAENLDAYLRQFASERCVRSSNPQAYFCAMMDRACTSAGE